jgi:purine-nucleoside phosphorylase
VTAAGFDRADRAASALRARLGDFVPEALLVLGSGLGYLADEVKDALPVPYDALPGFPVSTAPGHMGRFVFGELAGRRVMVMQGRFHGYEGYGMDEVALPLYTAARLGASAMLVTNAAGAVNTVFSPGDIMLITDHLKLFGDSPLRGPNPPGHDRFPDMTFCYTPALLTVARQAADALGIPLREGVYMYFPGPQYETPAEIRAARALGADAVGMSTVPEVIAARHAGLDVLGFSLLCNMAAGVSGQPLSEGEVLDAAAAARPVFSRLVLRCLAQV